MTRSPAKKSFFNQSVDLMNGPIFQSLVIFMLPILVSSLFQQLYNTVDTMIVGNVLGDTALAAIGACGAIYELLVGFGIGIGNGLAIVAARSYGAGDDEQLKQTVAGSIVIGLIASAVITLAGAMGLHPLLELLDTPVEIFEDAYRYIIIIDYGVFIMFAYNLCAGLLRAIGNSFMPLVFLLLSSGLNILLDLLFIARMGMGVQGAAVATVIGQVVSCVLAVIFHFRLIKEIDSGWRYIRPSGSVIGKIYSIGLPAIIAQALMSVMTYGLNLILVQISENAVTAYGLYYKIQQFILFAAFGLRDAITPIVSFGYGMGSRERVKQGIKYGMLYTLIIMAAGLVLLEIFAQPFAALFGLSGETEQLCISAMRVISLSFIFAGVNVAFQGIFQALESGVQSLVISVCRQILFVLPVAWGFSLVVRNSGSTDMMWLVWLTFLIAEGLSAVIAVILMTGISRRRISTLGN